MRIIFFSTNSTFVFILAAELLAAVVDVVAVSLFAFLVLLWFIILTQCDL